MDLCAVEDVTLEPRVPRLAPTGLTIELPPGFDYPITLGYDSCFALTLQVLELANAVP